MNYYVADHIIEYVFEHVGDDTVLKSDLPIQLRLKNYYSIHALNNDNIFITKLKVFSAAELYNFIRDSIDKIKDRITHVMLMTQTNLNNISHNLKFLKNLKSIKFYDDFNTDIDFIKELPDITNIVFGFNFNKKITPLEHLKNIKHITFGWNFNQDITSLRGLKCLESIRFGLKFNKPIDALQNLSHLNSVIFGSFFSHPVNCLKDLVELKFITISERYKKDLHKHINKNTKVLFI